MNIVRKPDASTNAAVLGGVPLATVTVWIVENFMLPKHYKLDTTTAVAIGSVGAAVFGELWVTFKRLLDRIGNGRVTE